MIEVSIAAFLRLLIQITFSPKGKYKDFRFFKIFEVAIIQIRPLKKPALQRYLPDKKRPPVQDHHMALGGGASLM